MRTAYVFAAAAAGIVAGWTLRPLSGHHGQAPAAPALVEPRDASPLVERVELAGMIRAIVREEVGSALSHGAATPAVTIRPAAPPDAPQEKRTEPTPEQATARDRGLAIIDGARGAGRWTTQNQLELRESLAQVDDDGRDELLRTLNAALNRGELKIEGRGAPF